MVRCPHCHASLADGARFCPACGGAVDDAAGGAVDLARTMPASGLERFAGMALGEETMLDPGPVGGPTGLLQAARASAGGPPPAPSPPKPPPAPAPARAPRPPPAPAPSRPPPMPAEPTGLADTADPIPAVDVPPAAAPVKPRTSAPRPGDPPAPGETIDGYVIEEEIGRGGMGRVYRATHGVTGQEVALKMLKPQVATGRVRERFVNEARVLARVDHPNLVPLLGFVDLPRGLFIIMPFVRGITLEQMLRRQGRLALDVVGPLFAGLCAGVAHIHAQSLLHRDLKPGNIIVQSDGQPRLTDFGIAREAGSQGLTATGLVIGTAEYIAPELANGTVRDDPRSDQYSLGCLLYQMLVGQPPFRHPNVGQLLVKHIQDPVPPPRTIAPDIPKAVEKVILKALAKAPDDRYPDVDALAAALKAATGDAPRPASPAPAPDAPPAEGRAVWPWIALALLLAGLGGGAWWWLTRT